MESTINYWLINVAHTLNYSACQTDRNAVYQVVNSHTTNPCLLPSTYECIFSMVYYKFVIVIYGDTACRWIQTHIHTKQLIREDFSFWNSWLSLPCNDIFIIEHRQANWIDLSLDIFFHRQCAQRLSVVMILIIHKNAFPKKNAESKNIKNICIDSFNESFFFYCLRILSYFIWNYSHGIIRFFLKKDNVFDEID